MAIVKQRGNTLHIQWYDPATQKVNSKSTGLKVTDANLRKAELYALKLQTELTRRNQELKQIGIKKITIRDAFEHFLRNNQHKHPKTIYEYKNFYKHFVTFFDENSPCASMTKMDVEFWLNEIKNLHFSRNTIHTIGKQCLHFLNFLFEYNYLPLFKINKEVKTRPEVKEKIIFSDEDIKLIFENLKSKNLNFKTLVYLAFYTGLRSSDIINIKAKSIDMKERVLQYYSPKRKRYREIPFHIDLIGVLKEQSKRVDDGPILNYARPENLGRAIERYFIKLGIKHKGYSARTFRKTFITLCRSRYYIDASVVRELVGHEHGNTTDRYYNQINIDVMKKELKKFKRPGT